MPRIFAVWRTPTVGTIEPQNAAGGISMSVRRKIRSLVERRFVVPHSYGKHNVYQLIVRERRAC